MNPILMNVIFSALFLLGAVYLYIKLNVLKKKSVESSVVSENTGRNLIKVMVPRENERSPQAAEQMFAALHGIYRPGMKDQPHISFEIVSKHNTISFYISTPNEYTNFVINQVYAQYPHVEVIDISDDEDYTVLAPHHIVAATELSLARDAVYPIKTFMNFDVDPLAGITGVLSSLGDEEEIWIQTMIKPIDDSWQEKGEKIIKDIKDPPKFESMLKVILKEIFHFTYGIAKGTVTNLGEAEAAKKEEKKPSEMTGSQQTAIKGIEEKISLLGFASQVRIMSVGLNEVMAHTKLQQVIAAYKQFSTISQNSFTFREITNDRLSMDLFKARTFGETDNIFNIVELGSLYHFPSMTVTSPTIAWSGSKKGEPPANLPIPDENDTQEMTVFAQTNFRNSMRKFGIKKTDRRLHMYCIGKTGTGKSTLLENMIVDDIERGRGVGVVDPHGELIKHILEYIPENRINDVVLFNPADVDNPIGFNLLENVNAEYKNIVASGVVGVFKKIFGESWGPRLEYILRNTIMALLDYPKSTLLGINRVLTDAAYRRDVVNIIKDPVIRDFFVNEYEKYDPKFRAEAIAPIQNKVGQFLSSSVIRNIVGQPNSTIDINKIMDDGKIFLVDLSIGKIGEDNSALLGSMLITRIQLAAMARTNMPEDERRDFYLYVDEFQNFATESFAVILSEARKYHLNLIMANQYVSQMLESVANAVFGNVGTLVSFRVGSHDADVIQKELEPVFSTTDLVNLSNYQIYLKMAINGVTTPAFSASTLPRKAEKSGLEDQIISASRRNWASRRDDVEEYISEWSMPIELNQIRRDAVQPRQASGETGESKVEKGDSSIEKPIEKPETGESAEEKPKIDQAQSVPDEMIGSQPEKPETGESVPEKIGETEDGGFENKKLPPNIEIIKDRFNRSWYAVIEDEVASTPEVENSSSVDDTMDNEEKKAIEDIKKEEAIDISEDDFFAKATDDSSSHVVDIEDKKDVPTYPQSGGEVAQIHENELAKVEVPEDHLITFEETAQIVPKSDSQSELAKLNSNNDDLEPVKEI